MDELMKLDIQMFAEKADNESEEEVNNEPLLEDELGLTDSDEATEDADGEETEEEEQEDQEEEQEDQEEELDEDIDESSEEETEEDDTEDKKWTPKDYSKRLNEERKKIAEEERQRIVREKEEELNSLAKRQGYESWEKYHEAIDSQKLEEMGIYNKEEFKEYLNEVIANAPEVKQAREYMKKQEEERQREYVNSQIKEINKLNPEIKTLNDLVGIDRYEQFDDKVKKGYELADAYKIVYFDRISKPKQPNAINKESKKHLKTTAGGPGEHINVPEDVMIAYKNAVPTWTDDQIRKHYAKTTLEQ